MSNNNVFIEEEDIDIIKSYIKDGYTDSEIIELADYTIDQIKYVRKINTYSQYTRDKGNKTFSDQTVNVFCKFLNQGCSNENLYDLFQLWNKITRKSFYVFCQKLRTKKIYTNITKNYNIPTTPTIPYESKFLDKDFVEIDLEHYKNDKYLDEVKSLQRKKSAELDRIKTREAIKRKENEEKSKAKKKQASELKKTKDTKKVVNKIHDDNVSFTTKLESEKTANDILFSHLNCDDVLPDTIVNKICQLIKNGLDDNKIATIIGVSEKCIHSIRDGKEYTDISKHYGIMSSDKKEYLENMIKLIEDN